MNCYIFDTFNIGVNEHCYMINRFIITVNSVLFNFASYVFSHALYVFPRPIWWISFHHEYGTDFFSVIKHEDVYNMEQKHESCVAQDKPLIHQSYGEVVQTVGRAAPIIRCASPPLCLRNKPRRFATAHSWMINNIRNTQKNRKESYREPSLAYHIWKHYDGKNINISHMQNDLFLQKKRLVIGSSTTVEQWLYDTNGK